MANQKLELKHLAPYLPYKLKMYAPYGFRPNYKESTDKNRICYLTGDLYADIENNTYQDEVFKPILRPLSDLKVIPEEDKNTDSWIKKLNNILKDSSLTDSEYIRYNMKVDFDLDFEFDGTDMGCFYFNASYGHVVYDFLFENHFDVFGLIEKGLAVDVNTIES